MNPKTSGTIIFAIVLVTFIAGATVYLRVDNVALAFGVPVILFILGGLWALLPAIDLLARGFAGCRSIYDFVWILLSAVLAYAYALKLGSALGGQVDVLHAMMPAIAAPMRISTPAIMQRGRPKRCVLAQSLSEESVQGVRIPKNQLRRKWGTSSQAHRSQLEFKSWHPNCSMCHSFEGRPEFAQGQSEEVQHVNDT